jgi:hypothetical protein
MSFLLEDCVLIVQYLRQVKLHSKFGIIMGELSVVLRAMITVAKLL